MKEVAKRAGVGMGTVSRYINKNGYVSEESRKKIEDAIKALNYIPNQLGRNLQAQRSGLVALFVPTISHVFFSKIAFYIEDYLYKKGFKMIIVSSQGKRDKEVHLLNMIKTGQVDGIIFITNHLYQDVDFKGLNIVTLDRHLDNVPCVTSDNYESTFKAIEHLVQKGCHHIGYIGGMSTAPSETQKRYFAYLDVMQKYNMVPTSCYKNVYHGEEFVVAKQFMQENPTLDGIFAQSDTFANTCFQIATQLGKKVPEEIKIIAFDGVMDEILQHPKFTVVKQDIEALAVAIVNQLILRINHETSEEFIFVPTNLILGETT
ncbi:MAG: LacI family DNA-binding transcriptional regulator [Bacilli bacterium]